MNGASGAAVDFSRAVPLALPLDFQAAQPRHFGAPAASSEPLRAGSFEGDVARGASCNCHSVTLVPHCNGTHTESACHLTLQQRPLHEILPAAPIPALLLSVPPVAAGDSGEDSYPAPAAGDRLITRVGLLSAWVHHPAGVPRALLLRTGTHWSETAPPYLSRQCAAELVVRGIEHLITDLPSVDRLQDQGRLSAHRLFFGLPTGSNTLADAARPTATITELATFPAQLADGPCAVQIQIPAWSGDAVPSRPIYLPLVEP